MLTQMGMFPVLPDSGWILLHVPFADSDDTEEVAGVSVLLAGEVSLLVCELVQQRLEVDVG